MAIKHVGRVKATGKKCIVVYRTLPGESNSCLIAPTENLPDSYHDALINLVESNAGQTADEFATVMARSLFPDSSNMLSALHTQSRLVKIGTDAIEMTPTTATVVVLSELNQIIAEQRGLTVADLAIKTTTTADTIAETPIVEQAAVVLTPEEQAAAYRKEAARLLDEAEKLVPTVVVSNTESITKPVKIVASKR